MASCSCTFFDVLELKCKIDRSYQRSVTYDFLRYINILTYLLTYQCVYASLPLEIHNGQFMK